MIALTILLTVWVALAIFVGFTIWWLREFPVPPIVDIQNHPGVRRPIRRGDFEKINWLEGELFSVTASSAVAVTSLTASKS